MGSKRTAWHFLFAIMLRERAPAGIDIAQEVAVTEELQRIDIVAVRRTAELAPAGDEPRVLRGLWAKLGAHALFEYKSHIHPARRGDWLRLFGYAFQYHVHQVDLLQARDDLTVVLLVAHLTPTLRREADMMGWTMRPDGAGYWRVEGAPYPALLVEIDLAAAEENDPLLASFGDANIEGEATRWWSHHLEAPEVKDMVNKLEGYDDAIERFLKTLTPKQLLARLSPEERLAGLSPKERLADLSPKERLADLSPQERLADLSDEERRNVALLNLPVDALRALTAEYLASLPDDIQQAIARRLAH